MTSFKPENRIKKNITRAVNLKALINCTADDCTFAASFQSCLHELMSRKDYLHSREEFEKAKLL